MKTKEQQSKPSKAKKANFIGLKIDDSLLKHINDESSKNERSVSAQIRHILNQHYNNKTNN